GQLARLLEQELHLNHASEPGAGAAGGLGFGLRSFAGARLEPGFERFTQAAVLDQRLQRAQLVITAEGAIDSSTLMGKGVGEIASRCQRFNVPCIGLAGMVANTDPLSAKFTALHALTPDLTTVDQAMREPATWLERLAQKAGAAWKD
ncbi:MAG: glycerate 2-kinase, partial [Verrucomicrobiota bacterium]